jgi:ligand-binding sensor domain-containing protein
VRTSKQLLLALLYAGAAPGQQPAASLPTLTQVAVPLPTQFVLNSWDTTLGLPEETISSLTQTPDGYLWLANADGLVRYDGSSFQTYQPRRDLGGGVRQEISRIGPGPDNTVWVYSKAYGLVRFQQGSSGMLRSIRSAAMPAHD